MYFHVHNMSDVVRTTGADTVERTYVIVSCLSVSRRGGGGRPRDARESYRCSPGPATIEKSRIRRM